MWPICDFTIISATFVSVNHNKYSLPADNLGSTNPKIWSRSFFRGRVSTVRGWRRGPEEGWGDRAPRSCVPAPRLIQPRPPVSCWVRVRKRGHVTPAAAEDKTQTQIYSNSGRVCLFALPVLRDARTRDDSRRAPHRSHQAWTSSSQRYERDRAFFPATNQFFPSPGRRSSAFDHRTPHHLEIRRRDAEVFTLLMAHAKVFVRISSLRIRELIPIFRKRRPAIFFEEML